jgi:hypothetical protein
MKGNLQIHQVEQHVQSTWSVHTDVGQTDVGQKLNNFSKTRESAIVLTFFANNYADYSQTCHTMQYKG